MFYCFNDQKERATFGGSSFLELQYCKMKKGTPAETIVSVSSINHWQDDSIYINIDDAPEFISNYGDIFQDGLYNNMKRGMIDTTGINYYSPSQVLKIISAVELKKPAEYALLSDWLKKAAPYNGVYILGI